MGDNSAASGMFLLGDRLLVPAFHLLDAQARYDWFSRYSHEPLRARVSLRARVWELRHNLTAYDASHLTLAETLDGSVLVTGDGGLHEVAVESLGADRASGDSPKPETRLGYTPIATADDFGFAAPAPHRF